MGKDKNKINPTPGVYYDNEEEARKVELARAQNSWTESGETAKGTEDPNEMYGGDIEPAVFVAETKKIEDVVPSPTIPQVATTSEKGEPEITFPEPTNEHSLTNVPEIQGKAVVEGPSDAEKALRKTYDDESKRLDLTIKDLEGRRANALAQDETAQRRGRSMKMIAGISDSLASLANLIGVGQGGSNIDTTKGALTPLEQKLEAARLERKADIKSIDDRLDQYRKQMNQVKMQKDAALAAYKQNKENQAYQSAEAEKGRAFQSTEAEKGRQFQASEAEKTRTHQTGLKLQDSAVTQAKIKSDAYQKALDRSNKLEVARINAEAKKQNSSSKNTEQFIVKDADGKESIVSMPKETAKAVMNDFENIIEADLEDPNNTALAKAYAKYKGLVAQRGILGGDTEEILDARKALISLSPSLQERIKQYGVSADSTSTTSNPTSGASSEAGKKWRQRGH